MRSVSSLNIVTILVCLPSLLAIKKTTEGLRCMLQTVALRYICLHYMFRCIPVMTTSAWKPTAGTEMRIFRDLDFTSDGIVYKSWTGLAHKHCRDSNEDTSDDVVKEHWECDNIWRGWCVTTCTMVSLVLLTFRLYMYSQES